MLAVCYEKCNFAKNPIGIENFNYSFMRKFYTTLFAIMLACAAGSAQTTVAPSKVKAPETGQVRKTVKNERLARNGHRSPSKMLKIARSSEAPEAAVSRMRVVAGPSDNPAYIDERPEGTSQVYLKSGLGYGYNWLAGMWVEDLDGAITEIVTAPDGETVYMFHPFSQYATDGWLKGTKSGDILSFEMPQIAMREDYYGTIYDDYAMCVKYDEVEDWYFPCDNQAYQLKLNADGTMSQVDPEVMLGYCAWVDDEWSWQACGDEITGFSPLTEKTVEIPSTVVFDNWWMINDGFATPIPVSFDGDKVYIKGLFNEAGMEEAVTVGDYDAATSKVTLKSGQYLGECWDYSSTAYFMAVDPEDLGFGYYQYTMRDELVFDYDPEKKTLTTDHSYVISASKDRIYYFIAVLTPMLKYQSLDDVNVERLNAPVFQDYYPEDIEYEYCAELYFQLSNIDADGQVFDSSKLYWNLIMDDEVFVFMPDEYLDLSESMTNVPCDFNESSDFYSYAGSVGCLIYPEGYDSLGARAVYIDGDKKVYSDIMWVPGFESALRDVTIGSTEVSEIRYYDLQGRIVENPSAGLYIRSVTFTDGRVKNSKVVKR